MKLNYSIESRDFSVTAPIIEEVERCLSKVTERYSMLYTDVTLEKTPNGYHTQLSTREDTGPVAIANGEHEDLYASIGMARDRLLKKLRRSREKRRDTARHQSEGLGRVLAEAS